MAVITGATLNATGFGYQIHLIHAQADGRYWLFYTDGTAGVLKTATSSDLLTWTANANVPLASGYTLADGNDFSVAYASLGGADVVHIVTNVVSGGSHYTTFHTRAIIGSGSITAETPIALPDTDSSGSQGSSGGSCPNAGPATVITPDGHVYDVTAWTGHAGNTTCDTNIYLSPGVDTGSSWNTGAFTHDGYYVSLPDYDYSHNLVPLVEAGTVLVVYPDQDYAGLTLFNLFIGVLPPLTFSGGGPGTTGVYDTDAPAQLFNGTGATSSYDDWTTCRRTDTDIHVIRHVTSTGNDVANFEEVIYNGAAWAQATSPLPTLTSPSNSGVVLLGDGTPGDGILLAAIGTDNTISVYKWTPGTQWTLATTIPGSAAVTRQALAGTGCGASRPVLLWTEGTGAPYTVMRADVSAWL